MLPKTQILTLPNQKGVGEKVTILPNKKKCGGKTKHQKGTRIMTTFISIIITALLVKLAYNWCKNHLDDDVEGFAD